MQEIGLVVAACRMIGAARVLAVLYLVLGLAAVPLLAVAVPPFQPPDESVHLMRAAHLADFRLIGRIYERSDGRGGRESGGPTDPALLTVIQPFTALTGRPDQQVTAQMWQPEYLWSEARVARGFIAALYPPWFYAPQTAAVLVGRAVGLSVARTVVLARIMTGVCAVALGAVAIALAGNGAVWLYTLLSLPMAWAGAAAAGPDALLIASCALVAALLWRGRRAVSRQGWVVAVVLLCLVATTRPPYAGLALLPLAMPGVARGARWLGAGCVLAAVALWSALAAATGVVNVGVSVGADPATQLALLLAEPWRVAAVARATLETFGAGYRYGFIGVLGTLDTMLPVAYYQAATWVLGLAALATMLAPRGSGGGWGQAGLVLGGVLAAAAGVFGILYLTWSMPGDPVVHGAQGRYFLPLAMLAGVALPALGQGRLSPMLRRGLVGVLAVFPLLSLGVAMRAVVLRFYLS